MHHETSSRGLLSGEAADTAALVSAFEQKLRTAIVAAALALNASGLRFAVFKDTRCNDVFWTRTSNGGWQLRRDANPANAVRDIFRNGSRYATECATAMGIVYYKAILEVYGDDLFNKTFANGAIYLMDWDIRAPLLRRVGQMQALNGAPLLAGDRAYFANPDHALDLPQWQGENVIVLGDGRYYGHGIGVADAQHILNSLNSKRWSAATGGEPRPAYLMDKAARPDFRKLAEVFYSDGATAVWRVFPPAIPVTAVEGKSGFLHIADERLFV
jgi:protein-glutamine gamma-glutamyltransferase